MPSFKRPRSLIALLTVSLFLLSAWLFSSGESVSADLVGSAEYIIVLNDEAARDANAGPEDSRPSVREQASEMQTRYGFERVGFIYEHVLKGFSAYMTVEQANQLANDPRVALVEADTVFTPVANPEFATTDLPGTIAATAPPVGTEYAAAYAAGAVALYLDQYPSTGAQAQQALIDNATSGVITNPGPGSPNLLLYTGFLGNASTEIPSTWGLDRIDQRNLPLDGSYSYQTTGSNVTVYIIGSGIQGDFDGRAQHVFDCTGTGPGDALGAGTQMAAIVGGPGGVAKGVQLRAVKVLDDTGSGNVACLIAGIDYVAASSGPRVGVVGTGLGNSSAVNQAVDGAVNRGAAIVTPAGNLNANACNYSPSSAPLGLTVGAIDTSDQRSSFSSFGTCLDIFAPEVALSAIPDLCDSLGLSPTGRYHDFSGLCGTESPLSQCYAEGGTKWNRYLCNLAFYSDMRAACNEQWSRTDWRERYSCYSVARIYYLALQYLGSTYFNYLAA